jgi:MFS family permease
MQDYQAMLLKGVCTLALLQCTWALTSPLKRLRRATTVTKGANVGLASLKPADLKIAGSAACGSYIQGYTTGVLGGALLFLGPHFGLTPAQIGAVATATTLGSVLGTFSASALADAAGRRPTMAFSSALFVAASVLMVWTPSLDVLVLARFLAGVGIGNCGAVVPVYVAECAEAASRGALATLPQLMISSGAMSGLVVTFAVALCRTGLGWSAATASRVSLGFTLLPSLLYAALVLRLPESPRYLLRKGRRERALAALGTLRGGPCEAELTAL